MKNTELILEQERVLTEIQRAKEELADSLREFEEEKRKLGAAGEEEENVQKIFNIENMESLQELLDQAEESDQMLLFVDRKGNTWQLIRRADVDLAEGNESESGSPAKNERQVVV